MSINDILEFYDNSPFTEDEIKAVFSTVCEILEKIPDDVIKRAILKGCFCISITGDTVVFLNFDADSVAEFDNSTTVELDKLLPGLSSVEISLRRKSFVLEMCEGVFNFEDELFLDKISSLFEGKISVDYPYIGMPLSVLLP